jgi:hypothetical protein
MAVPFSRRQTLGLQLIVILPVMKGIRRGETRRFEDCPAIRIASGFWS